MTNLENFNFVIRSGVPNFLHSSNGGRVRKDNELIRTILRLEVGQYIHLPCSREKVKDATKVAKNNIAVAKSRIKDSNPNIKISYGVAVDNGVFGVSIIRCADKTPKSPSLFTSNLGV